MIAGAEFTAFLTEIKKQLHLHSYIRYMVMPWKMVTRRGENLTLKEAVQETEKEGEENQ